MSWGRKHSRLRGEAKAFGIKRDTISNPGKLYIALASTMIDSRTDRLSALAYVS